MQRKGIFIITLMLCLMGSMFGGAVYASTSNITTGNTRAGQDGFDYDRVIRVGYYENFNDFIVDLDSYSSKGYGYDVFEKIEEISDFKFEYIPIKESLFDAVNDGIVDIAGFLTKSPEREELVLYSDMEYSKTYVALMTNDMEILYNDPSAIDGKTVATYPDNIGTAKLDRYCELNDISVEYLYGTAGDYMTLDADFYITYIEDSFSYVANNVLNLGVYSLYTVTSFENQQLMDELDAIFYSMVSTEGNYFLELENKYLSENIEINHRSLTNNEVAILQQRPLEVGYIADFQPISFQNEDGEPDGAMVETLNLFAERYGFELNYHPYSLDDDPSIHKDFDIMLTIYGSSEQHLEYYVTTESYIDIPMVAQIQSDIYKSSTTNYDLISNSGKIGLLPYCSIKEDSFSQSYSENKLVHYYDWHDLLNAYSRGEIGSLISTESGAAYAQMYLSEIDSISVDTDLSIPMQFFISNEIAEDYLPIFNVMLDRVPPDEYRTILNNHSNLFFPKTTLLHFIQNYWHIIAIITLFILGCFVAIYYHGQLNKREALLTSYNTDRLTGLMSMTRFSAVMEDLIKDSKPNEYELISFDVDMFKTINTHFSTDRGTDVILAISKSLKEAFSNTTAIICRRMADQFLVLRRTNEGKSIKQIYKQDIAPNIRDNVNEKYKVTLSFGNYIIEDPKEKVSAIIGQTDTARRHGKDIHKTTFITFDEKMRKKYDNKINITFRMEQAIKDKEFYVEYQPKIDFSSLRVGGAEALVRWKPKFGDKIYPDEFIPIFEENGFIASLDLFVLEETCKFIKTNRRKLDLPRISVNLSAHTVLADDITSRIYNILSSHDISPNQIELELTESAVEGNTSKFLEIVKRFKKFGFSISIDDFGAGVSSLNRLSAVDADILKLDKAFFDLKDQGSKSATVVADVITMANHLNMKVVAEGVETSAQAFWLRSIGCDYAQGYYFAKPMSENDFKSLLESNKEYTISL